MNKPAPSPPPAAHAVSRAKTAINAAMDLFHRRWMLRVVWELREGALTFRALQARCGDLSPSVLNQRLAELRDAGLVSLAEDGYRLEAIGRDMITAFEPLTRWALRWQRGLDRQAPVSRSGGHQAHETGTVPRSVRRKPGA